MSLLSRCFAGTYEQMYQSLIGVLAKLPPATKVYCGHEYTIANLEFCLTQGTAAESLIKHMFASSFCYGGLVFYNSHFCIAILLHREMIMLPSAIWQLQTLTDLVSGSVWDQMVIIQQPGQSSSGQKSSENRAYQLCPQPLGYGTALLSAAHSLLYQ